MNENKCNLCNNKGYIITLNTQTDVREIQKCDTCKVFKTDEEAEKEVIKNVANNRKIKLFIK